MLKLTHATLSLLVLLLHCDTNTIGTKSGGGASETVATVTSWGSSFKVVISNEGPFSVTAEVCSNAYSFNDTSFFHMKQVLTEAYPEWEIPYFPDLTSSIIIRSNTDSTALYLTLEKYVTPKTLSKSDTLVQTGAVRGLLQQQTSDGGLVPLSGVRIGIMGSYYETITNETGEYLLKNLPKGRFFLYPAASYQLPKENSNPTEIVISADTTIVKDIIIP